jgi:hypothetical protein
VITTAADGAQSVYAVDLDGDGDADVLSASFNDDKIAWYENLRDCDQDGLEDADEISSGTSTDLDGNGIPDDCEDCNFNGQPDSLDIGSGLEQDCNGNGVPDQCDIYLFGTSENCNPLSNDIPDECEIAANPLLDCDQNGILDQCEPAFDCNSNGQVDSCDIFTGLSQDCDANGVPDECDPDCDANGVPDACENPSDCDNSGVDDSCEIAQDPNLDLNGNGVLDSCECATPVEYCLPGANSSGNLARIEALGLPSISVNQFTLRVSGMPANQFGVYFHGANAANQIFGDGRLCVASPITRMNPPSVSTAGGVIERQVDLGLYGLGSLSAGETRRFQLWFRDPQGGVFGFTFSSAVAVEFCP